MTRPHWETTKRTLRKAGFVHVSGWVPENEAANLQALIDRHKKRVEEIKGGAGE
jgi:vacuolar-type H+-ATPase subunit I/STV1